MSGRKDFSTAESLAGLFVLATSPAYTAYVAWVVWVLWGWFAVPRFYAVTWLEVWGMLVLASFVKSFLFERAATVRVEPVHIFQNRLITVPISLMALSVLWLAQKAFA